MIKIVDIKINNKNPTTTEIFFKFEDNHIDNDRYIFLKDKLYTFKFYIDNDYTMESELEYDEILEDILIGITIIIPEKLMPIDLEKCTEIIINKINLFRKFYETQNELYYRKQENCLEWMFYKFNIMDII